MNLKYILVLCISSWLFSSGCYSLTNSSDVNSTLLMAAKKSNVKDINRALEQGASPNFQDENGNSAMRVATVYSCTKCLNLLIENGGDVNLFNPKRKENLIFDAASLMHFPVLKILVENGANLDVLNSSGDSILINLVI
jgi:ankyrin repeat protein